MNLELLRKDQLYFADKHDKDGASELYSISEFSTRTTENIRKGYLVGKYGATPDIEIEAVEWCLAQQSQQSLQSRTLSFFVRAKANRLMLNMSQIVSLYHDAAKEAEDIFDRWADEFDDLDEDYEPDEFFSD